MANISKQFQQELKKMKGTPLGEFIAQESELLAKAMGIVTPKVRKEIELGLARPVHDEMKIVPYSDKSFAVVGEQTILYRDELLELGGTYNPHLKCGKGWIFSNKHTDDVKNFLTALYPKGKGRTHR